MAWIATPNLRLITSSALVAMICAAVACRPDARRPPGTPAPDFQTSFDSATPAQILDYLEKLRFDKSAGASDEKRLTKNGQPGPLVAIHPEKRSHKNIHDSLATGPGRIIAMLINRDTQPYPKYNLGPKDTVYWAVSRFKRVNDTLSEGRSVFISHAALVGKGGTVAVVDSLFIDRHRSRDPRYDSLYKRGAKARWIEPWWIKVGGATMENMPQGDRLQGPPIIAYAAWNNCESGGCCRR